MIVEIKKDRERGVIEYLEKTKEVKVSFPDKEIEKKIKKYLTSKKEYWRATDAKLIGFEEIIKMYPYENEDSFKGALLELFGRFGIWVDWDTKR